MTPEKIERELRRLAVDQAVNQLTLVYLARAVANSGPDLLRAIASGFDDAASFTESIAL